MHPFHILHVLSLQSLDQREVGWSNSSWLYLFLPHHCDQYLHHLNTDINCYTPPMPLHWTFHPILIKEALGNILMNAQRLLFTHPRGVSPVSCWAGDGQLIHCGASSVSLFWVCSSRVVVAHLACLPCTTVQRWVPSVRTMRKVNFGAGLMNIQSSDFSWGRKGFLLQFGAPLCRLPPPTNPSPSSSPCRHQL